MIKITLENASQVQSVKDFMDCQLLTNCSLNGAQYSIEVDSDTGLSVNYSSEIVAQVLFNEMAGILN